MNVSILQTDFVVNIILLIGRLVKRDLQTGTRFLWKNGLVLRLRGWAWRQGLLGGAFLRLARGGRQPEAADGGRIFHSQGGSFHFQGSCELLRYRHESFRFLRVKRGFASVACRVVCFFCEMRHGSHFPAGGRRLNCICRTAMATNFHRMLIRKRGLLPSGTSNAEGFAWG